jgi:type IV pilus assembly protein PilC
MSDFSYTAVNDFGQRVSGTAAAETEDQLAELLRSRGEHLVNARAKTAATPFSEIRILESVNRRDVIFFTSQLATVFSTGVNLIDGLKDMEQQVEKRVVKVVVTGVRQGIESGLSLSDSLARYPKVFNDLYVSVVRAGEATGRAERALEDLVAQLEWQEDLTNRIREALTYPVIVLVLLGIVSAVLVSFTIPQIMKVYANLNLNIPLPLPTRIIMAVTGFIRTNWLAFVAGGIALVIAFRMQWETEDGRARIQGWLLGVPVVGELLRKIAFSRFAHYFATMHGAGLEVAPSMALIERLFGNEYLARRFHRAVERVMAGDSLSHALSMVGEFPAVVIQMIGLGERTGRMERSLEDVRKYYDKEVERSVRRALTLFGPISLILLASVFVTMAIAFYLPLFRMLRVIPTTTPPLR